MRFDPGIEIICGMGVYEPAEDSMLMLGSVEVNAGDRVFEAGCGSGIIALHCAKAGADVTASDISQGATECARENASRNNLKIKVLAGDLLDAADGRYDLIIFNPPYLPEGGADDPIWTGGRMGTELTLRFLEQCRTRLSPGGRVFAIVSSLSGQKGFEEAADRIGFAHKIVNRSRIFFEELAVYELALRTER